MNVKIKNRTCSFRKIAVIILLMGFVFYDVLAAGLAQRVADIYSGATGSGPAYLAAFNNKLYFRANGNDGAGTELWMYDGNNAPSRVADIWSGASSSFPSFLTEFNNKLHFQANGGDGAGTELWVYDGSNPPSRAADIYSGIGNSNPAYLATFNNKLYFRADGGDGAGIELWVYDGSNPPSRVVDIYSGTNNSNPAFQTVFNNKLYFQADGGDGAGAELWKFFEDSTPPQVSSTTPANGATITPTNTIEVTFSEDMTHDGDTGAANYSDNYLLVEANGNGFQTTACNATDLVNDTRINIDSASYNNHGGAGPFETTLGINQGNPLPNGSYHLFICGTTSVTDLAGNKINGGADSVVSFTVSSLITLPALPQTGFAPGVITQVGSQPSAKAYQDMGGLTLEIPSLSIKAPIVGVPRTSQGWDLSWLGNNAGWLEGTSFPTWAGNSALTAHVVDSNGQPGLFADLGKLSYGKEIVISAWGQRYVYQVRSVKTAVKPEDVSAFRHKDFPYLTLITCKGFDEKSNTYRWRVVVQAVQVRVE